MSIKVYINVELEGYSEQKSKLPLPKSWVATKEVKDVIGLFVKSYNAKQTATPLDAENVHLALADGSQIYSNLIIEGALQDHEDYYIKLGAHFKEEAKAEVIDESRLRCKNYGCNKYFTEEENVEGCCVHHTGPPIFHDTMKCWSCCRDRKAFDFESFQLITGCNSGKHSTIAQNVTIAPSPNNPVPGAAAGADANAVNSSSAAPLKSIDDYNKANPAAASATDAAAKVNIRKSSRSADGLTAKCLRQGCQKKFNVADINTEVCTYHKGNAVFHDAVKFWSCCPDKKFFEFEEFLKFPGCCTGLHDDGEDV